MKCFLLKCLLLNYKRRAPLLSLSLCCLLLSIGASVSAQMLIEEISSEDNGTEPGALVEPIEPLTAEELSELVGPIASVRRPASRR